MPAIFMRAPGAKSGSSFDPQRNTLTMSIRQPGFIGLAFGFNKRGAPLKVQFTDFNNHDSVADIEPEEGESSASVRTFKITPNRPDTVTLEARDASVNPIWRLCPLSASVQVVVAVDTAEEAHSRADAFASAQATLGQSPGNGLAPATWEYLLKFTKKHEGIVDFMYNDKGNPQKVTCGVGLMFKDAVEAKKNTNLFVTWQGEEASGDEVQADFDAAAGLKRTDANLYDFATVTKLRLPPDNISKLLIKSMTEHFNSMRTLFPDFASFPVAAQVACASISFGSPLWAYNQLQPALQAAKSKDWEKAAQVYNDPGWDASKGNGHRALFRLAAQVTPGQPGNLPGSIL